MALSQPAAERLYKLLPAIYRERDADLGEPLRALLAIVQQQADLVESDIEQLWNDFFIETCEPWVIPYLGDLVGATPLFDSSRIRQPDTAKDLFPDLTGPRLIPEVAARSRADVAKTIYYRRRKGTLPMLEELARDVSGWGGHAVEFFKLLVWSQAVRNHIRLESAATPDLRQVEPNDRLNGPFDSIAHTVDVRPINQLDGWYNPKNIGFFLWRLRSYETEAVQARRVGPAGDFRYHFSPLGNAAPLFSRWRREGDEAGLASEFHVPGPIRPAAFYEDLRGYLTSGAAQGFTEFYGLFDSVTDPAANPSGLPEAPQGASLMIFRDGVAARPERVRCMDLSTWQQPSGQVVGVDVRLGRMAFGDLWVPNEGVEVFYHYGFSADLGGGPYRRAAWAVRPQLSDLQIEVEQSGSTPGAAASLNQALTRWQDAGRPNAVIRILDSRTYQEAISIEPAPGRWLAIEAADGVRPHLLLDGPLEVSGATAGEADSPESSLTLNGLLIEGWIQVSGSLGRLRLLHSTLVPGRALSPGGCPLTAEPSLLVEGGSGDELINKFLRLEIAFCITGPLRIPPHAQGLWLLDSILDAHLPTVEEGLFDCASNGFESGVALSAPEQASSPPVGSPPEVEFRPAPPAWLERVTVLGTSFVKELAMASEVIFSQPVFAQRQQKGCVRFSYLSPGSETPRRFRCQPDLEIAARQNKAVERAKAAAEPFGDPEKLAIRSEVERWLVPAFTTDIYGQPAYAQLHLACPEQIQKGAEDGSEMGVFSHLKQPQREANLRLRLEEYLPVGLKAGIIFVT